MHVRFSACIGLVVVDDGTEDTLGLLSAPLVHPDTGVVEGFFVGIPHFLYTETMFVSTADIVHWGAAVRVRDAESLAPLSERLRLQALVDEGRTVMGQRMVTEAGAPLGICRDIQFDTKTFMLEWLFPRRFLRWGIAMPASAIVEVKPEAVILREMALRKEVDVKPPILTQLEELAKAPAAGMMDNR